MHLRRARHAFDLLFALAACATLSGGCAMTPSNAASSGRNQLLVQFTFGRGRINPVDHYFFALDTTGDSSQGPVPVIAPPWGNGWGAGRITRYVQIDLAQPGAGRIGVYAFKPDSNLLASTYIGQPLGYDSIDNTNTIRFTLDLDTLQTPTGGPAGLISFNFIATDRIPLDPNDRSNKLVDALGVSGNNYVTIDARKNGIYRNADLSQPETTGDVADPDLDISDWQVEVRRK